MEEKECPICGDKGSIIVSCLITEKNDVIPIVVAPCPRCRKRNKEY